MFRRIDNQDIIHFFSQIVHKGPRQRYGNACLTGDTADDATVKHDRTALPVGLTHFFDDGVGLSGDGFFAELARLRRMPAQFYTKTAFAVPVADNIARELMAGAQKDIRRAPALAQHHIGLFPGAGKGHGNPVEVQAFARAVINDHHAMLAQMPQQIILANPRFTQNNTAAQPAFQHGIAFHVVQSGRKEIKAGLHRANDFVPHADKTVQHGQIKKNAPIGVTEKKYGGRAMGILKIFAQGRGRLLGLTHGLADFRARGQPLLPVFGHSRQAEKAGQFQTVEQTPRAAHVPGQLTVRHGLQILPDQGQFQHFLLPQGGGAAAFAPGVAQAETLRQHQIGHPLDQARRNQRALSHIL